MFTCFVTQRIADERTAKAAELEQKVALLEVVRNRLEFLYYPNSFPWNKLMFLDFLGNSTIHYQVECANLNQELQDMEARVRRGQKKSPEEANQAIQVYFFIIPDFLKFRQIQACVSIL